MEVRNICKQEDIMVNLTWRKWTWIGHVLVVVTHTKVNSIPKVNNTKVNLPRELRYRGVCGHTRNTLPRSILHTWLVSARNAKMDNSRELASIVSLLLLILFRQSSNALLYQLFIQRRIPIVRRVKKTRSTLKSILKTGHFTGPIKLAVSIE